MEDLHGKVHGASRRIVYRCKDQAAFSSQSFAAGLFLILDGYDRIPELITRATTIYLNCC